MEAQAVEHLRSVSEEPHQEGIKAVRQRVLHGHPAVVIMDTALQLANSLISMTTHGRSGVGRWVLGGITDRLVRHSGGPVLVIRATEESGA